MSEAEDESDSPTALLTSSSATENGGTVTRERRRAAEEKSRRESRSSHLRFLAVIFCAVVLVVVTLAIGLSVGLSRSQQSSKLPRDPVRRAEALLTEFPVIDGLVPTFP